MAKCRCEHSKGLSFVFGRAVSIRISRIEILSWRGSLPFSGVMFTVLFFEVEVGPLEHECFSASHACFF
jgi:hypothetical protein